MENLDLYQKVRSVPVSYTHLDVYKRQFNGFKCLLQVFQDIINMFGADGQTDGSRPDSLLQKLGLI